VARYQFAVLGLWAGMGADRLQSTISGIKALNPNIKLAQYVMLAESRDESNTAWQALNANDWWLRDANNNRVQWTTEYSAYDINVTAWAPNYSSTKNWALVKSKYDTDTLLSKMKNLDYVFLDGMGAPATSADWKNNGTTQSMTDPTVVSEFRKGYMRYLAALRSQNPTLKGAIGNVSTDAIVSAEYRGQIEGAYRECLIGRTWSIETWGGWEAMMDSYRKALANTKAPKAVFVGACAPSKDAAMYRYGMASTMLEDDGYFAFSEGMYYGTLPWYDESEAPLGTAAEVPPTAPNSDGIWSRKYTNGIVLVNPSKTTARTYNATGYYRIKGKYDTVVNNGLAAGYVTLQPRSGLMLLKQKQ